MREKPFMTTAWTHLAMLNFEVDPAVLEPLVPCCTQLDFYKGRCLVSMVGFRFNHTRVFGIPLPWHRNFAEVNLRFYVRRFTREGWRRGVVFVREIVKLPLVAWAARFYYDENFMVLPLRYGDDGETFRYEWKFRNREQRLRVRRQGEPHRPAADSEEKFVVDHNWGYTRLADGTTAEFYVDHPPWRVWDVAKSEFTCDVAELYGEEFAPALQAVPSSAILVEGSPVVVYRGRRITSEVQEDDTLLCDEVLMAQV